MSEQRSHGALRRAGVIGDVHCEDELLERLLEHYRREDVDAVLCVGDIPDGYGDINRACMLLQEHRVLCVTGNHDRWLLTGELRDEPHATPIGAARRDTRAFLEGLPPTRSLDTLQGKLLLCHGTNDDDMTAVRREHLRYDLDNNVALQRLLKSAKYRFLVGGHTHQTMVRRVKDLTVINPGTLHRDYPQTSALLDFEAEEVVFYDLEGGTVKRGECLHFPERDELDSRVLRL